MRPLSLILHDLSGVLPTRIIESTEFCDRVHMTEDARLIVPDWGGNVREYDLTTLTIVADYPHAGRVWTSTLSADQTHIATAVHGELYVRVFRRGRRDAVATFAIGAQTRGLALSPDGQLLLSASDNGAVRLFDLRTNVERWRHDLRGIVYDCAFAPDGQTCAAGGAERQVLVLSAADGSVVQRLVHDADIARMTFQPQGQLLAVRTSDVKHNTHLGAIVWEYATGREVARLRHEDTVHHIEWSPDGSQLATVSQDKRTRVFQAPHFGEVVRISFNELATHAAFSRSGRQLFSAGSEGVLRISMARPEDVLALARQRVPRQLTEDEWRQYLGEEPPAT